MAHKPQSFKLVEKKDGKKYIVLYKNVRLPEEEALTSFYLKEGYIPMYEEKKPTTKVADMKKALKADPKALEEFETIYATKGTGFFDACKYYNDWKKSNKSKD